jgi:glycosyltransferase involved in cell wall biosynthesis
MPSLTAFLHTKNDALRLGRCLETTYPCDAIVIVDHGSTDETLNVAHEFGANVLCPVSEAETKKALLTTSLISTQWLLCLDPRESLSEALAASLFDWKTGSPEANTYALQLRQESVQGWIDDPVPKTRLVPANWDRWNSRFPMNQPNSAMLEGNLLRFAFP